VNLAGLVADHRAPSRALHDGERWHTWGELRGRAASVAAGLVDLGVRPADRVVILWPTSVDFVVAYLGVLAAGAVAVPLNSHSPPAEIQRELDVVEPAAVLAGIPVEVGGAVRVVRASAPARPGAAANGATWDDLSHEAAPGRQGELSALRRDDADLAVLLFTSGTAGDPRAAMLTHGNLLANLDQMRRLPEILRPDDVGYTALPLSHVFGLNVALGLTLATGAALALDSRFDAARALRRVADLGVTTLLGVPTMFAAWAALPEAEVAATDTGSPPFAGVRRAISGAAALDPAVAQRFEQRFGVAVWQGYGLTEASPAVTTSLGTGRSRPGSVGPPLPGVEIRLVDESGGPALEGDPGEIWVRGPNVFAGYWRDPDATARVLTPDGWLRTGDIGVIDENGDLFIVDRAKDLVIVSGFNVFPAEVERVLASIPGVVDAVVVGSPDAATGEKVEAVIVPDAHAGVTEQLVREHCAANLARYKCPASIRFVDELPRGLSGKALRRAVRAMLG
jgi:long-chain acyl-CoA synthetase